VAAFEANAATRVRHVLREARCRKHFFCDVATHVGNLLLKLGMPSRVQLAEHLSWMVGGR